MTYDPDAPSIPLDDNKPTPRPWGKPMKKRGDAADSKWIMGQTRVDEMHWGPDGHILGSMYRGPDRDLVIECVNACSQFENPAADIEMLCKIIDLCFAKIEEVDHEIFNSGGGACGGGGKADDAFREDRDAWNAYLDFRNKKKNERSTST